MVKCPGQDMRYWKAEDIFEVVCSSCGNVIEFWKDEPFRMCPSCQKEVRNPRIDLGCAKWCKFAEECLGKKNSLANPLIESIKHKLLEIDGVEENIVRYASLLSDNIEEVNEDDTAFRKIEALLDIVVEECSIKLSQEFFEGLNLELELHNRLCKRFVL